MRFVLHLSCSTSLSFVLNLILLFACSLGLLLKRRVRFSNQFTCKVAKVVGGEELAWFFNPAVLLLALWSSICIEQQRQDVFAFPESQTLIFALFVVFIGVDDSYIL